MLTELNLEGVGIGESGATALADNLKYITNLENLNLENVYEFDPIENAGMEAIASQFSLLRNLRELSISNNGCGRQGIEAFNRECHHLVNLTDLSSSFGNYTDIENDGLPANKSFLLRIARGELPRLAHFHSDFYFEYFFKNYFPPPEIPGISVSHLLWFVRNYPLHVAAVFGDVALVRELIQSRIDVDTVDEVFSVCSHKKPFCLSDSRRVCFALCGLREAGRGHSRVGPRGWGEPADKRQGVASVYLWYSSQDDIGAERFRCCRLCRAWISNKSAAGRDDFHGGGREARADDQERDEALQTVRNARE